jgi:hypothetical protein
MNKKYKRRQNQNKKPYVGSRIHLVFQTGFFVIEKRIPADTIHNTAAIAEKIEGASERAKAISLIHRERKSALLGSFAQKAFR